MKVDLEKHQFGDLLERDIAEAISKTELAPYTLNNLVIHHNEKWYQLDHLIILPHKIAIIEAKNSTSDAYIVGKQEDSFIFFPDIKTYGSSIVRQTNRARQLINTLFRGKPTNRDLSKHIGNNLNIEVVGCVRCIEVRNEQTSLPIYTDETIWYYLKTLEAELQGYNKLVTQSLFTARKDYIEQYVRTNEEYRQHLISQGLFNTSKMTIPSELTKKKKLTLEDSDGGIHSTHTKRERRFSDFKRYLLQELDYLPPNYRAFALQHPDVPLGSLVEYYCAVDLVQRHYPTILDKLEKFKPYVKDTFIVDYCKTVNVFFIEVLYEIARIYHIQDNEMKLNPSKSTTSARPNELHLLRLIEDIQYGNLRNTK